MKRFFTLKCLQWTLLAGCLLPAGLSAQLSSGVALRTTDTDEPEPRTPELTLEYGEVNISEADNGAIIREDLGIRDGASGGIRRLYWENDAASDWRFFLDTRYLRNPDELYVNYEMHNGYNAFFDLSFSRWSEYDLPGELYDPATDAFPLLSAEAFKEEISKLKLSLTLMPTDVLKLKLQYGYFEREGTSLSTAYGDDFAYRTGMASVSRGIIPALYSGNERVHTGDVALVYEEEAHRAGFRLHYQKRRVDRERIVERAAEQADANRYTTQRVESDDDLFSVSAFNRAEIRDNIVGSVGFAITRLDGDLTGSRVFGANPEAEYDIDFPATQLYDRGYLDLLNSRRLKQIIINANLVYTPSENFRWMAGLRLEHLSTEAFSSYLDTFSTVDFGDLEFQDQEALTTASSEKNASDISGFIEGRYTGYKHLLFYSRIEASNQSGDLDEDWQRQELVPDEASSLSLLDRTTDFERSRAYWEAGVNFFPINKLRISVEGYLKYNENRYDWGGVLLPDDDFTLYPGYIRNQDFTTQDINARVQCRLIPNVNSVTRVDVQRTTIESGSAFTKTIESSERERAVFNQSLVWTPHARFFLSGTVSVIEDLTKTGASELTSGFEGIILNLPNDYWHTDLNLYFVVSKIVDLQLSYQYLEMTQFVDNSPKTVAYGIDLEQHHGMAQLLFHFNPRLVANIAYHVYDRSEPSAFGRKDYTVHLVNGGLQFLF